MALKTITGTLTRSDGTPVAQALVNVQLSAQAVITGTQEIAPNPLPAKTGADGTWSIAVHANLDLTPTTTYYTFSLGSNFTCTAVVPQTAGPFELSNIMATPPVVSPPGALDSAVVHLANPETITGAKDFAGGAKVVHQQVMPQLRNRFVAVGDSHFVPSGGSLGSTTQAAPYASTQSYGKTLGAHVQALLQGRLILQGIFGAAGHTSATVLNTLQPQVLAMNPLPGYMLLLIGTNDTVFSTWASNVKQVLSISRANGIEPILCTLPPRNDGAATALLRQMNNWIFQFAANSGIEVVDFFGMLTDPTTGQFRTGYNFDSIHSSWKGAWAAAHAAADLTLPPSARPYLTRDTADPMNMLANGTMAGAGPLPTSWVARTVDINFVDSVVPGDGSITGNWYQLQATGVSDHEVQQHITTGFSAGDVLAASGLLSVSGSSGGGGANVQILTNGTFQQWYLADTMQLDVDRWFMYMEIVVPTPVPNSIDFILKTNAGAVTARYAQMTLVNLTANNLASLGSV